MALHLKLSQMKKVSSTPTHTTMLTPGGHSVTVRHSSISAPHRKALSMLPMAEGGEVSKEDPTQEHLLPGDQVPNKIEKQVVSKARKKMADGGDPADLPPVPAIAQQDNSQVIPDTSAQSAESIPVNVPGVTPDQAPQAQQPAAQPSPQRAPSSDDQGMAAQQPASSQVPEAGAEQGYENQVKGIQAVAQAEGQAADAKATALKTQLLAEQKVATDHADAQKAVTDNLQAIRNDINNTHIDPNHYLGNQDTLSKIGTSIALVLGGIGGGGRGNQVLDFVNRQIDNDINAQKANLGKKESIYSGILAQSANEREATNMTRLIMNDMTLNKLQQAEATAQNPMAKARAQQAIGTLQTQMAPLIQQQTMFQMLNKGNGGSIQGMDPSQLVRFVVPEPQQNKVFGEIEAAQNTKRMGGSIMKAFDDATKENTALKTGAGLLRTPASVYALHQAMQPTFKDLEGTVRQAAMDNTFTNITPRPGDSDHTIAQKREALASYLQSKASAPTAKGYGIDLNNFASTSTQPVAQLSPQQQSFVAWAKANPNDPRAPLVLKKLGIQ